MTRFEYIVAFVSILIGIAVADLFSSLHHLLRARRRVRWHWLPLLAGASVLFGLVQTWWAFFRIGQEAALGNLFRFLVYLPQPALLFLAAASVLPDSAPEGEIDLLAHYFEERRYLYGTLALYLAYIIIADLVGAGTLISRATALNMAMLLLVLSMARSRSVPVHAMLLLGMVTLVGVSVMLYGLEIG